jgi:pimeloyl-ACP methyl ester carboxylesterase
VREAWTRAGDRLVRALSTGEPDGLPEIVILPGLGAPSYVEPWARELGRWTRATVLDLPGWRWGRGTASPSTVPGVATGAAGWLAATGRRDVVLIGHSSGSQSAIRTALAVPDRLAGLVLAGPTLEPAARSWRSAMVRLVRAIVHEKLTEIPAVLPEHLLGGFGWFRLVRSVIRDRPEDVAGELDLPVLVVTGTRDRFAPPDWAEQLAELCAGRYETLPGAHNTCFTFPVAAGAAVRRSVVGWAGVPNP